MKPRRSRHYLPTAHCSEETEVTVIALHRRPDTISKHAEMKQIHFSAPESFPVVSKYSFS